MSRLIAALVVIALAALTLAASPCINGTALAAPDTVKKEPARQVPVEEIEEPEADHAPVHTGSVTDAAGEEAPDDGTRETLPDQKDPEITDSGSDDTEAADGEGGSSAPPAPPRNPAKVTRRNDSPDKQDQVQRPDDGTRGMAALPEKDDVTAEVPKGVKQAIPGLPARKPAKPPVPITGRLNPDVKKTGRNRKLPPPGRARDKYLCKALQACRNEFIRCKSKIKYPDQSKEWSIAKEECGAYYKACVQKDFQPGQWFFTRWFYFQELQCE